MAKKPSPIQNRSRQYLDNRTHQEEPEPLTDDEVRRQLGFDLLPDGGDREGDED